MTLEFWIKQILDFVEASAFARGTGFRGDFAIDFKKDYSSKFFEESFVNSRT